MVGPRLGIVIPALNEESSIGAVIRGCRMQGLPIVVDDGSSDRTTDVALIEGAEVVRHERNRGYDAALNSGLQRAADLDCAFVVTIDADGQHDPAIIQRFLALLEGGADVVVGVRDRRARLSERVFGWVTEFLYGLSDPLCGLKGYRLSLYRSLGHVDSFGSVGTELTLYAVRNGYRLEQVPLVIRERAGQSRFGHRVRANFVIGRAMLGTFLGRRRREKAAS